MDFFYKESKSKKQKKKIYIFFSVLEEWGKGVEGGLLIDFFYKESKTTHFLCVCVCGGGGGGLEGVVWRGGSTARVSEFFLQRIQIKKKSIIILALVVTEILT